MSTKLLMILVELLSGQFEFVSSSTREKERTASFVTITPRLCAREPQELGALIIA
jgi:hypothetical protein